MENFTWSDTSYPPTFARSMKSHWGFGLILLLLLVSARGFSSVVVPSDGPYYRYLDEEGRTLYIYDQNAGTFTNQLMGYTRAIRKQYEASFGWKLSERTDLILTSPRQQVANAYATFNPNLKTVWYPSGAQLMEYMAETSWVLGLTTHETAHLYQLDAKGEVSNYANKVFGNAPLVIPYLLPVFIFPNVFLPTFIVEGNAVMNESRFNLGGRLHSGEVRALVFAQIAADEIDPVRLINDELRFPYGETPYLQGGYFQAHLASKYGIERTNKFFLAHGDHFLWPLILNKTFRKHFGESYPQEIREYVREYYGLAKQQRIADGPALVTDEEIGPMNHDANRVWFLSNSLRENPRLHIFDKTSRTWKSRQLDLPMGKVFFPDAPKSATSEMHDLHHEEYSLYGEDAEFDPAYRSMIVTDQRAGKTVALDPVNSWLDPHLLVNGENFDIAHSGAVVDDKGQVYYFRQNGTQRLLYRDRLPVFKYDGFYGKLTEVTADGTIYFIANTESGSTLYRYRNSEITRVLPSDRVVDAREIAPGKFLATEVQASGHRVVEMAEKLEAQSPVVYAYGFPSATLVPEKAVAKEQIQADQREYNSFSQQRFSELGLIMTNTDDGLWTDVNAFFTDPLQYQAFNLRYSGNEHDDKHYLIEYDFTKYLVDVFARYTFFDDRWEDFQGVRHSAPMQSFDLGINVPLLRHKRWDANFNTFAYFKLEDSHFALRRQEYTGVFNTFDLQYSVNPYVGFMPWREFKFSFINELETLINKFEKNDNTNEVLAGFTYGLPRQTYFSGSGGFAWAETDDVIVDYSPYPFPGSVYIPRLTDHTELFVKRAGFARLEFHQAFDVLDYSARFPIGLDRVAPMLAFEQLFLDDNVPYDQERRPFEYGFGLDIGLLILHKAHGTFRLFQGYDGNVDSNGRLQASFALKQTF